MRIVAILGVLLVLVPSPAPACSLCGGSARTISLLQEYDQADAILFGKIANAKSDAKGLPGAGTTEFHIEKLVKPDGPPRGQMIVLSRWLPIDAKDPPRYVMFFRKGNPQPYTGRQLNSAAVMDFIAALQPLSEVERLHRAGKHLDDPDTHIADEAFLVFARADDKLIGQAAKKLSAATLRKLIKTPDLDPERLSMFAYLLGACGDANDLELLQGLLKDRRNFRAYEGILAGYITLRPKDGWEYTHELIRNEKTTFLLRYASLRTLRFFYNAHPEETAKHVIHGLNLAIDRQDVADIAITDLRNWKRWEHTAKILACFEQTSHRSPIVKNSIVRYALACPQPEAKAFVDRVRRQDPDLVRYLEEELK